MVGDVSRKSLTKYKFVEKEHIKVWMKDLPSVMASECNMCMLHDGRIAMRNITLLKTGTIIFRGDLVEQQQHEGTYGYLQPESSRCLLYQVKDDDGRSVITMYSQDDHRHTATLAPPARHTWSGGLRPCVHEAGWTAVVDAESSTLTVCSDNGECGLYLVLSTQ
jgi:hypothetical protein